MDIAIVADDLTGAADAAAPFAGGRRWVRVLLQLNVELGGDVVAVDTASRDLAPRQAAEVVTAAVGRLAPHRPAHWFKKLDSTLRGNIAGEVAAFARATGYDRLIIAPAYPAQRRQTVDGVQLAEGRPATGERAGSHLPTLLAATGLPILTAGGSEAGCSGRLEALLRGAALPALVICDAASDAELDQIVAAGLACRERTGFAGSAGLAEALQRAVYGAECADPMPLVGKGDALIVVGTLQEASRRQLAVLAREAGVAPILLPATGGRDAEDERVAADALLRSLRLAGVAALTTAPERSDAPPLAIAQRLAGLAAELIRDGRTRRVFVTGGEVARALCDTLGLRALRLCAVIADGVPVMAAEDGVPELTLVTKAGGFGDEWTLLRAVTYLSGRKLQA